MKVKDVKKKQKQKNKQKKQPCTYFKTLWAEKSFSAACFPSCLIGYLLYLLKKKKKNLQKKNFKITPELLYSIEIFSKRYSMGCSRSQAPMRLFLCIFDKVFGRKGLLQQVTHLNNLKTWTWELQEVELMQRLVRGVIWKSLKFGHLAFYEEDWRHNIHMLTIFSQKVGLAGYGEGTHQNQVAIYLETYFIRKTRKNCLLYIDILFNFIFWK